MTTMMIMMMMTTMMIMVTMAMIMMACGAYDLCVDFIKFIHKDVSSPSPATKSVMLRAMTSSTT